MAKKSEMTSAVNVLTAYGGERRGKPDNLVFALGYDDNWDAFAEDFPGTIEFDDHGYATISLGITVVEESGAEIVRLDPVKFAETAANYVVGNQDGVTPFHGDFGEDLWGVVEPLANEFSPELWEHSYTPDTTESGVIAMYADPEFDRGIFYASQLGKFRIYGSGITEMAGVAA